MTVKPRIPNLVNVNRIVINRVSVWEHDDEVGMWYKISGGPGFNPQSKNHIRDSNKMKSLVSKKLSQTHNIKVFENWNTIVFEDKLAYRYWISEETLNIVMRSF